METFTPVEPKKTTSLAIITPTKTSLIPNNTMYIERANTRTKNSEHSNVYSLEREPLAPKTIRITEDDIQEGRTQGNYRQRTDSTTASVLLTHGRYYEILAQTLSPKSGTSTRKTMKSRYKYYIYIYIYTVVYRLQLIFK